MKNLQELEAQLRESLVNHFESGYIINDGFTGLTEKEGVFALRDSILGNCLLAINAVGVCYHGHNYTSAAAQNLGIGYKDALELEFGFMAMPHMVPDSPYAELGYKLRQWCEMTGIYNVRKAQK